MSKMLAKNTLRDISRTKARFISIMLIMMLGVGFLVGIHSTAPSMYAVAEKYYTDTNLMDFRLLSTVGFTEEDVEAVAEMEGVGDVMPSYFLDVLSADEKQDVVRLYAMPEVYGNSAAINTPVLKEGRLPEKADEILIGDSTFGSVKLGDKVSFTSAVEGEALSDSLKNTQFTVVGIVDSSMYISFERGVTNVGSGEISTYMIIPKENFSNERYTELYVTFEELAQYSPYSDDYKEACKEFESKLEAMGDVRVESFLSENIHTAQSSIDEAKTLLEEERTKAEKELADAQKTIDDGKAELGSKTASAKEELQSAREKIDSGYAELEEKKTEYEQTVSQYEAEIEKAEQEISDAKAQLALGKAEMKEGLYSAVSAFGVTREQFDEMYGDRDMLTEEDAETLADHAKTYKLLADLQLLAAQKTVQNMEAQAEALGVSAESLDGYTEAVAKCGELSAMCSALEEFISTGKDELLLGISEINSAEAEIEKAEEELSAGKAEFSEKTLEAKAMIEKAEETLAQAESEYAKGVSELRSTSESAEKTLRDAQSELDKNRTLAEDEIEKAEREIQDAQETLDEFSAPKWYINNRDDNPGYSSYRENVERVNAVGKVFPMFFMLVAVLVCVTTLSRLVEEQRGDIGALCTLGYSKRDIMSKYIAYSVSATLIGSGVGIVLGVLAIPTVVFEAYGILYSMPDLILKLNVTSSVISVLVAVLCVSAVTFFTCNALLRKKPATLLRPKAPKPGKRILLERIGFLWNRMSFFAKVTARNIFRYKARFFMTVIGVAGCTALLVSGLGLHDSINDIIDKQFKEIFTYDVVIACDGDSTELKKAISEDKRLSASILCRQSAVSAESESKKSQEGTYIFVPENIGDSAEILHLRNRETGEILSLDTEGAVVSEKLANTLGLEVGDSITVADNGTEAELIVSGISENYVNGYVFMSSKTYENNFGSAPEYGMFMCVGSEGTDLTDDDLGKDYLAREDVLGVSFVSSAIEVFDDTIQSLNYVVLVMIISAAALAFVVLYNLTNINIAERKREISTLKVLGFKDTETSAYIYRENIVLTLFGVLAGLVLGVWLLDYIIVTIEVDMVMFGRDIHPLTFLWSGLLTMVFSVFVNMVMHLRIKVIDMIESLKSVE